MENQQNIQDPNRKINKGPHLAADAIILKKDNSILLITRGHNPQKGTFAIPGGHVDYGEDPQIGVLRELQEECNLKGKNPKLFGVYGDPKRDPRKHMVSIVYEVELEDENQKPVFADDAASAEFVSISKIKQLTADMFFADHHKIISYFLKSKNL